MSGYDAVKRKVLSRVQKVARDWSVVPRQPAQLILCLLTFWLIIVTIIGYGILTTCDFEESEQTFSTRHGKQKQSNHRSTSHACLKRTRIQPHAYLTANMELQMNIDLGKF